MLVTFLRIALAGIRGRALAALLTALLAAVTAAVLTLALGLRSVADEPWDRTFRETNGAHLIALGGPEVARLARLPGVVEAAPPVPGSFTSFALAGQRFALNALATGPEPPRVERPAVTSGRWLTAADEIVLEQSFAAALGIRPGDAVDAAASSGRIRLRVVGVAAIASGAPYPDHQPGIGFVARDALVAIQPDSERWIWSQAVRLSEPARADELAGRARQSFRPESRVVVESWFERRSEAGDRSRTTTIVLTAYSALLLVAGVLVLVNLVGGRAVTRHREIGLLKAVGFTPRLVALLFLVEQLLLGLAGAGAGVAGGAVLLPLVAGDSAALLASTPATVTGAHVALSIAAVCTLMAVATVLPTIRGARLGVVHALAAGRSRRSAGAASRSIPLGRPLPLTLGLKEALGRSSRTLIAALALTVTVAALVAGLTFETTTRNEANIDAGALAAISRPGDRAAPGAADQLAPGHPDPIAVPGMSARLRPIVHSLNAVLVLIAAINLLAIVVLTVRERTRDLAVLKAIGLTPAQLGRSVHAAQTVAVAAASALGIPLGLALFLGVYAIVNGDTDRTAIPPWWALAATPLLLAAAVWAITLAPARRASQLDVTTALSRE
ncbi:MAG: FtsX-like permease family protein [Thermoleophilia bacterium]